MESSGMKGLCECGCGERTTISPHTDRRKNWIGGEPRRFIAGHGNRPPGPAYIANESGCWIWQRGRQTNGYGLSWRNGGPIPAHRLYYELAVGPIPQGLELDHLCRTPLCVNPDHLEPVTRAENVHRGLSTKLTADEVRQIRAMSCSNTEAARAFGVHNSTISRIRSREAWGSI